jgi:predicted N-formylglutamate amidohydrolase
MGVAEAVRSDGFEPVARYNSDGSGSFVITCDHASNFMPAEFGGLGLGAADLLRHIAWDPGALGVSRTMSHLLDAPLIAGGASRLLIDCNRPLSAVDLIAEKSETTTIPGNTGLSPKQRLSRVERFYNPFHEMLDLAISQKTDRGVRPGIIAVHSFNPIYKGVSRPWEIGIIHDDDDEWAFAIVDRLRAKGKMTVGVNEPYSPKDRVYFTLERHARSRGLPAVMIEIRNDEIAETRDQQSWGELLAEIVGDAYKGLAKGDMGLGVAGARAAG